MQQFLTTSKRMHIFAFKSGSNCMYKVYMCFGAKKCIDGWFNRRVVPIQSFLCSFPCLTLGATAKLRSVREITVLARLPKRFSALMSVLLVRRFSRSNTSQSIRALTHRSNFCISQNLLPLFIHCKSIQPPTPTKSHWFH